MTQPRYLLRLDRRLYQASRLRVTRIEKREVISVVNVPRLGSLATTQGTGKYESGELRVAIDGTAEALLADGRRASSNRMGRIERTAGGVKKVIRRLRDQEAETLDRIDAEIVDLEGRISTLREQRKRIVAEAWARANVVRLNDVEQQIVGGW